MQHTVTQTSRPVTSLQLGNLVDVTKKEAAGMLPGSTAFYALRVALDSFRCVNECYLGISGVDTVQVEDTVSHGFSLFSCL